MRKAPALFLLLSLILAAAPDNLRAQTRPRRVGQTPPAPTAPRQTNPPRQTTAPPQAPATTSTTTAPATPARSQRQ